MEIKIYERTDKPTKKGNPLDFLIFGKKVSTGYHCVPGAWDVKHQIITPKDPTHRKLNKQLETATIEIKKLLHLPIEQIRLQYDSWVRSVDGIIQVKDTIQIKNPTKYGELTEAGKAFYMLIERIIHSHRSDWSEGYKKRMRSICTKTLDYDPHFTVDRLNQEWWRGFVSYCIEDLENISNTINTDTKAFKTLGKEIGKDINFDWGYIEPEVKGLTWSQVSKLETVELDIGPTYNASRILWLASAYTGRRWSEIVTIGPENFYQDKGKWRYRNIGKGNRPVDIRLLGEAVEFFKKINFKLPKVTNQQVNQDIKQICRIAGFKESHLIITPIGPNKVIKEIKEEWQTIHFHTARHSYCQRIVELFAGKPGAEKTISWLMGHASFQTTWKYMNRVASSNEALFDEIRL